jgi:hypothetical protein
MYKYLSVRKIGLSVEGYHKVRHGDTLFCAQGLRFYETISFFGVVCSFVQRDWASHSNNNNSAVMRIANLLPTRTEARQEG